MTRKQTTKKMGRPCLPAGDARAERFSARFTSAEACSIRRAAASAGVSITELIRTATLARAGRR